MKRCQFLSSAAAATVLSSHFVHGKKSVRVDQLTTESSSEGAASRIPRVSTAGTIRGEMLYRDNMMDVAQQHRFHFDTVQMPLNILDAHFRSFSQLVVPQAVKQQIAVLGMKCFGSGVILKSGVVEPIDCLHYSFNLPLSVLITGINTQQLLDQALPP